MPRPQLCPAQHENQRALVGHEVLGAPGADPFDDHRLKIALHGLEFPLRQREIPFVPVPNYHFIEPGLLDRSGTLVERGHVVRYAFEAKILHHLSGIRSRSATKPVARDESPPRPQDAMNVGVKRRLVRNLNDRILRKYDIEAFGFEWQRTRRDA